MPFLSWEAPEASRQTCFRPSYYHASVSWFCHRCVTQSLFLERKRAISSILFYNTKVKVWKICNAQKVQRGKKKNHPWFWNSGFSAPLSIWTHFLLVVFLCVGEVLLWRLTCFRFDTYFCKSLSAVISLQLFGCNSSTAGKEGPAINSRINGITDWN